MLLEPRLLRRDIGSSGVCVKLSRELGREAIDCLDSFLEDDPWSAWGRARDCGAVDVEKGWVGKKLTGRGQSFGDSALRGIYRQS